MAVAALPESIEEWTQEQRDSLLVIAERTLASYGKYAFSREFIARHVDDFVQDALLQAWVSQQDPEAEALRIYNPAGFVSFKVVQLALDKAKGERRRLERAAPDGVAAGEQEAFQTAAERVSDPIRTEEVHELVEHLQATKLAMSQLAERQRVAFVKCQLEGRSQTEVAKELSETSEQPVTRKAVERLVANARVSLSVAFSKVASGAFCEEQRQLLELVDNGWATPEQEEQAHAHLEDCSQCAQVRAFARFERDAGLAAITLPGFGVSNPAATATGLLGTIQDMTGAAAERAREFVTRVWPFGGGTEAGGAAMGTVTTTKAIVALCVAAGSAGTCVKVLSATPNHATKPAVHKQRQRPAQRASAPAPVVDAEQSSEAAASPPPRAREPSAQRAEKSSLRTARPRRSTASSPPATSSQETQQEFGFEGGSSPSTSSSGGASAATPSATAPSTADSFTPTASSGGGGGGSSGQTQQEFGIGP